MLATDTEVGIRSLTFEETRKRYDLMTLANAPPLDLVTFGTSNRDGRHRWGR